MSLVLDASMALAWLFERKSEQEINCAAQVLVAMTDTPVLVPALWHLEVSNALLVSERRRIITEAQIINYLKKLSDLPIVTDDIVLASHRGLIMALGREHRLTAYDAAYLDLALRTGSVLATFDVELADAMRRAGGRVFSES